ncbi:hypothetical protein ACFFP0_24800 [Rhizobium puerariae]|uniref:Uncharacterized protein n=1 Tax=Rhizobium puerariae TaxID=1585791 RepID=A0ABV6AN92_9HYPH
MDPNKLKRPLERWAGCAACAIASGSTAQMMYFGVEDAKSDIAALAAEVAARDALLREAYSALAFAFKRIHGSARTRDTELANDFAKTRGKIEKLLGKETEYRPEEISQSEALNLGVGGRGVVE